MTRFLKRYINIKPVCLLTAICFVTGCLMNIPSFASSTEPVQSSAAEPVQSSAAESEKEPAAKAADPASGESAGTVADPTPVPPPEAKQDPKPEEDESLWYSKKLPLKKEHQKLLWDYCKKRQLDYIDMLSLMYLESNFKEKASSGRYKGYFQISSKQGPNLSKTLKTLNKPLDGAININWGTALYSWILADKRVKDLEGQKKRDAALSIYQRGAGGYDKYGISKSYVKNFYKKRSIVCSYFEQEKKAH